jgi:hypothetical protein
MLREEAIRFIARHEEIRSHHLIILEQAYCVGISQFPNSFPSPFIKNHNVSKFKRVKDSLVIVSLTIFSVPCRNLFKF